MSAHIITIAGAKDSIGASTVAINLSFLLQKLTNSKVLLVDFDFSYQGDIAHYLKMKENCYLTDLFSFVEKNISKQMLEGFIPVHKEGVAIANGFNSDKITSHIEAQNFQNVFELLSEIYDFIIIDAGSNWTPLHAQSMALSSLIYLLTNQESSNLNAAQNKINKLIRAYIPKDKIRIILNQWNQESLTQQDFVNRFENFQTEALPDAGDSIKKTSEGNPLVIKDVRHDFTLSLERIIKTDLIDSKLKKATDKNLVLPELSLFVPFWAEINPVKTNSTYEKKQIVRDHGWDELKTTILKRLLREVDFKGIEIGKKRDKKSDAKLKEKTTEAILSIINDLGEEKVPSKKRKELVLEILDEAIGLGPLESLLADKSISEIMINGKDQIFIEQSGKITKTPLRFSSDDQLNLIIERIVAPIGRRVDESTPLVDARLPDGSRVNIIISPLSLVGSVITIRRFSETPFQVDDLIRYGSLTKEMSDFLKASIEAKLNIIVSGGTGSGKTTLLNVLSSFIPQDQRIITIEDSAELKLNQEHVIRLESRPANIEGTGDISIRTLLKNSLRMRPDRIVIGECRGGEALDMLQAMNTGHDGSLTTIHANSPRDCISRLETLVMFSGVQLPSKAIRSQISSAIDLVVQLNRLSDGSRKITKITEITGMEGDILTMQDIFEFKQTSVDKNKKVIGKLQATGFVPKFVETLKAKGIDLSLKSFT